MFMTAIFSVATAHAVIVNTVECINASTTAKQCCDDALAESCLDADAKVINTKLKSAQDLAHRRASGVHDVIEEAKAKVDLLRLNAQLTRRAAEHCEKLTNDCTTKCSNLNSSDAKFALSRCQTNGKIIDDLREQSARDEASAKRLSRGK